MDIDQDAEHAQPLVVFDKAHPAHVGRKVIHFRCSFAGPFAVGFVA